MAGGVKEECEPVQAGKYVHCVQRIATEATC